MACAPAPLLHEQDVDANLDVDDDDIDGGNDGDGDDGDNGQHAIVRLKKPLHINIPLDRVSVNERFYVRSRAFALADNDMQGESYYSAFLPRSRRDRRSPSRGPHHRPRSRGAAAR